MSKQSEENEVPGSSKLGGGGYWPCRDTWLVEGLSERGPRAHLLLGVFNDGDLV